MGSLLDQALTGGGGVALISGEAGGGKTALLDEFSQRAGLVHPGLIALRGRCSAYSGTGDTYLPFREMLQTLAGDVESKRAGGTLSPEQARRVWEALPEVGAALADHGPDLIDTFIPGDALLRRFESFSTPTRASHWQKRLREIATRSKESASTAQPDLFAQVTQVLHSLSVRTPLLLMIDDLQWADSGTEALLFHLGRSLAGSRILLICAYRPLNTRQVGQGPEPGIGTILQELAREWGDVLVDLDRSDGRAFVEALIDSEPNHLEEDFRLRLYDQTGGNPLFTVELLRSFERQGMLVQDEAGRWVEAAGLDWDYCPPQVEAVIAGHLAGLPDQDLELLQAAAIQGEQFTAEVTARVLSWGEEAVLQRLSGPLRRQHRLVEAVSLERLAASGQRLSHYRFRHALLQRSAYSSLDAVRKSQLHEATGRAMEAIYVAEGESPQTVAPALAWHYEAAGLRLKAARALHETGHQALRLSALRQALDLFDHGLALVADEPATAERREIQRLLEVDRLVTRRTLDGFGGSGSADAIRRATEAGAGDSFDRPRLLMIMVEGERLMVNGQFESGLALDEQLLDLATHWEDEVVAALTHWRIGLIHHSMGRLQEAEKDFDWILDWITPEREAELRGTAGSGLSAHALIISALDQWFLGHPEQALRRSAQAVAGKFEGKDLLGQAFASAVSCTVLFLLRGDRTALQERSELCLRLCKQQGFVLWQSYSEVFRGWLAVMRGEDAAGMGMMPGINQMQNAIAGWQASGMSMAKDSLVMVLADGCLAAARRRPTSDDAVRYSLLATGLVAIEPLLGPDVPSGQSYQPELYRLKGELLLERDGLAAADEALACFQQSLQIGREQGALAWELRAAMSLVRLRERQGETYAAELVEARKLLSDLYARFTEGFDFPDLQDAAALIGNWEPS
jgi:tetratricopeptide (TPR) repeat protein